MTKKKLDFIADLVSGLVLVIMVIWWCQLPSIVPIHLNLSAQPDKLGDKTMLLTLLLIPIFGFIPYHPEETEIHSQTPEEREAGLVKLNREMKKAGVKHLIASLIVASAMVFCMVSVSINVK